MFHTNMPQLENLAKLQHKNDHFQSLRMLVEAGIHKAQSPDVTFIQQTLTELEAKLQLMFNGFVDGEIRWISSQKSHSKNQGVLGPLLKFPAFVNQMENMFDQSFDAPMQVTTTYTKMAKALFTLIKETSELPQKFGRRVLVLVENFYFFWKVFNERLKKMKQQESRSQQVFDQRNNRISALESKVEEAYKLYTENLHAYVRWHVEYELPKLYKFWDELNDKFANNQQEELQYLIPKQTVMANVNKFIPKLKGDKGHIQNMLNRVEKHLPEKDNRLRVEVLSALKAYFMERYKRFETQVLQCYHSIKSLPKTSTEVKHIFQKAFEQKI